MQEILPFHAAVVTCFRFLILSETDHDFLKRWLVLKLCYTHLARSLSAPHLDQHAITSDEVSLMFHKGFFPFKTREETVSIILSSMTGFPP